MSDCRMTRQKRLIQQILPAHLTHPTADEIYELARAEAPDISRGTVYRILSQMVEAGQLLVITAPQGPNHYDYNTSDHGHFFCRRCQRVCDTPLRFKDDALGSLPSADLPGYQTESVTLLFSGLCPECREAISQETQTANGSPNTH